MNDLTPEDIETARDLIGLALASHNDDEGGRDRLVEAIKQNGEDRAIRIAGALIEQLASDVARQVDDGRTGEDLLRYYANSFAAGASE